MKDSISVIIPAGNQGARIGEIVAGIRERYETAEIIVVDDGSTDDTGAIAERAGSTVIRHPVPLGKGASVKSGTQAARGSILVLSDPEDRHSAAEIDSLLRLLEEGYDMAVGARSRKAHASSGRFFANRFCSSFASLISGQRILDITSGFRCVRAHLIRDFVYLLPNGFSWPTTITMAFLRSGHPVGFVPTDTEGRNGSRRFRPVRDAIRFLVVVFRIATLYSPLKVFVPASAGLFLVGVGYYAFTYFAYGRFTNMSVLVLSAAVIIFLIGLVSEQITALMYNRT